MFGQNRSKMFFLLVAFAVLLIFLTLFFGGSKTSGKFLSFISPISGGYFSTEGFMANSVKVIFSLKDTISENADLRSENKELLEKLVALEDIKKENKLLRGQLGMGQREGSILKEAKIISFEPSNLSKFLIINKGSSDGIKKDMPVIFPSNILIGKVFDVAETYSKVMLITDKSNKVNVRSFILGNDGREVYTGILNGYLGKSLFMDLIEKRSSVSDGDLILTSGLDGVYPENLIVGVVDIIKNEDGAVFKQAYLEPVFLSFKSNLVFVITKY